MIDWRLNQGYDLCDVWNADERASFYRVLPNKSLSEKGKQCKGGELSKKRKAAVLFANAAGGNAFYRRRWLLSAGAYKSGLQRIGRLTDHQRLTAR